MNFKRPLSDNLCFIGNKWKRGLGGCPCTVRSKLNKFKHIWQEGIPVQWSPSSTSLNIFVRKGPLCSEVPYLEGRAMTGGNALYRRGLRLGPCTGKSLPNRQTDTTENNYLPATSLAAVKINNKNKNDCYCNSSVDVCQPCDFEDFFDICCSIPLTALDHVQ